MQQTTVHIERPEGTTVASGLLCQIDSASAVGTVTVADEGHDRDALRYVLYFAWVPAVGVQRRDVVVADLLSDPVTGAAPRYRVTGYEVFDNDHVEALAEQTAGE